CQSLLKAKAKSDCLADNRASCFCVLLFPKRPRSKLGDLYTNLHSPPRPNPQRNAGFFDVRLALIVLLLPLACVWILWRWFTHKAQVRSQAEKPCVSSAGRKP